MQDKRTWYDNYNADSDVLGKLIVIVLAVCSVLVTIMCGGVFIGGFHVLKNYGISLKHNVIDSNRQLA